MMRPVPAVSQSAPNDDLTSLLLPATWQDQVSWMSHAGYVRVTEAFNLARMRQRL